jgi:hypothetical protein
MGEALVATYQNEMEARLLEEMLREEGIPSVVKPRGGGYGLFGQDPFIAHSVYVLEENLQKAREIAAEDPE